MSTGQIVGGVGGAIIGFVLGGPAGALKGAYWGYMAGSIVDPLPLPTVRGPRLEDLKAQSSVVGATLPLAFGTYAVSGNVIWASDLKETKHKDTAGGKGGPSQTQISYTYSQSMAIALAESATPGTRAFQGIRRIWANGKLIYTRKRPHQDVIDAAHDRNNGTAIGEAIAAMLEEMMRSLGASDSLERIMTVYDGTQTTADPVIESFEGVGNVPAFMDLGYVVFEDLQLADYGNRAPEFLFEIYTNGTPEHLDFDSYANDQLFPWRLGEHDPVNYGNVNEYARIGGGGPGAYSTLAAYIAADKPGYADWVFAYKVEGLTNDNMPAYPMAGDPSPYEGVRIFVAINYTVPGVPTAGGTPNGGVINESLAWGVMFTPGAPILGEMMPPDTLNWWSGFGGPTSQSTGIWYYSSTGNTSIGEAAFLPVTIDSGYTPYAPAAPYYLWKSDDLVEVTRTPAPPTDTADDPAYIAIPDVPGYFIDAMGQTWRGAVWAYDNSTTYKVLQKYTTSGLNVTKYPLSPARPVGHAQYSDSAFWIAAYDAAVAAGDMPGGLTYGVHYPATQSYGYINVAPDDVVNVFPVPVADIVSALCGRAGLTAGQIDVTDLDSMCDGYVVGSNSDGRAAINPVAMFGLFGAFESGGQLVFVERGAAPLVTLTADDLCAHESESDRPPAVEVTRKQDVELPRTMRVTYASPSRDYQQGEQLAARMTTPAINAVDVQLPISMSDSTALQLAEIYLFDAWTARNGYGFALDMSHLARTPTDVVELPVDGNVERVRIVSVDAGLPGIIACQAIRDDGEVVISYATRGDDAALENNLPTDVPLAGPTEVILLDIPAMRPTDNDAGYYAAGRGYLPEWNGYAILQSFNGGTEYTTIASCEDAATIGTLVSAFEGTASAIEVVADSGTFVSATSGELDAGANVLAIGAHGRWEILQFMTASLAGGVWTLGDFRRGLRGTSAYETTSLDGDRVVLISGKGILRVPLAPSLVNVPHYVKAASLGTNAADNAAQLFTSTGLSLQGGGLVFSPDDTLAVDFSDASAEIARQVFGP